MSQKKKIAAFLMASGQGKRFGSNKLLLNLNGSPLFLHAARALMQVPTLDVRILTVHPEVYRLSGLSGIPCLLHEHPHRNQAIALGMQSLVPSEYAGFLFCPADQPGLTSHTVSRLCDCFLRDPENIYRLHDGSCPGSPVIFPVRFARELSSLPEKAGGGFLLSAHPELVRYVHTPDPLELHDVDTPEDLLLFL